jgi:hypothetical protein
MNQIVLPGSAYLSVSPEGFHRLATQFLKCKRDSIPTTPDGFSLLPYYLLCHAIELEIKSKLLTTNDKLTIN